MQLLPFAAWIIGTMRECCQRSAGAVASFIDGVDVVFDLYPCRFFAACEDALADRLVHELV